MDKLSINGIELPQGVGGIFGDSNHIFIKGNIIQAGCEASGGNVITLTVNNINEIIQLDCDANQGSTNRCGNKNVDSETCLICPHIKNTTK